MSRRLNLEKDTTPPEKHRCYHCSDWKAFSLGQQRCGLGLEHGVHKAVMRTVPIFTLDDGTELRCPSHESSRFEVGVVPILLYSTEFVQYSTVPRFL